MVHDSRNHIFSRPYLSEIISFFKFFCTRWCFGLKTFFHTSRCIRTSSSKNVKKCIRPKQSAWCNNSYEFSIVVSATKALSHVCFCSYTLLISTNSETIYFCNCVNAMSCVTTSTDRKRSSSTGKWILFWKNPLIMM